MKIPSPPEIGLPEKFDQWRPGQFEALESMVTCNHRFDGHNVPTGGGKTGTYCGGALMEGGRFVILTATKGLQDQIMKDMGGHLPITSIKGKSNYTCSARPGWTCEDGHSGRCQFKGTEACSWTKDYFRALTKPIVVTNYSFFMSVHKYGMGLGNIDHLILDEAPAAFDELSSAMEVRISHHEIEEMLAAPLPKPLDSLDSWKVWSKPLRKVASDKAKQLDAKCQSSRDAKLTWIKEANHYRNLARKLSTLSMIRPQDWIVDTWEFGFQFDPIRPGRYAERMLYLGIPRISLFSASMIPKTLNMINIWDDYEFTDYPSTFDPAGNPIMAIPTAFMDSKSTLQDVANWIIRADQIIGQRLDRKGIFHTVSYPRAELFDSRSDFHEFIQRNKRGDITTSVVERFLGSDPPSLLVSPSVTTGYDFPFDACRYQIIGKVPWPDGRNKLMVARTQYDPQYGAYIAAQQLVQACGRGRRDNKDWCENFIIDNHIIKFMQRNGSSLTPRSFRDCYTDKLRYLPPPRSMAA